MRWRILAARSKPTPVFLQLIIVRARVYVLRKQFAEANADIEAYHQAGGTADTSRPHQFTALRQSKSRMQFKPPFSPIQMRKVPAWHPSAQSRPPRDRRQTPCVRGWMTISLMPRWRKISACSTQTGIARCAGAITRDDEIKEHIKPLR